jgi:hypothetical protein
MKKTFLLLLVLCALCTGIASAQTLSVEDIKKRVKDVRLPQDQLKSLAFDMHMNLPLPLNILCQLRYLAPDQYCLQVFDSHDDTPVLIIIDQTALVNDPLADNLTLVASAGVAFDLVPRGDEYNAQFAFNVPVDGKINNRVELDFTTMFSRVVKDIDISNASGGELVFSGKTEKESRCVAVFAPKQAYALRSTALFIPDHPDAILKIDNIRLDVASETVLSRFPMAELIASGVTFDKVQPQGMFDTALVAASVLKAVFARSAIRNQELREKIETMINQKVDWQGIKATDDSRSAKLRQLFKPL